MAKFLVFTDGACLGNPGPGGWGFLIKSGDTGATMAEGSGSAIATTNNKMELTAAIEALGDLKLMPKSEIVLFTDSKYVIQGITEWCKSWVKRGWRNSKGEPVANRELWERLIELNRIHDVTWRWVKGHNGHPENERVDDLASQAAKRAQFSMAS